MFEKPLAKNPEQKDGPDLRVERMLELRKKIYKDLDAYEKLADFIRGLEQKEKYGEEIRRYASFHIAAGSTPMKEWRDFPPDRIDFPGEDSIQKEMERLLS